MKGYFLIFLSLFVMGCSSISGHPSRTVDPSKELQTLEPYFSNDVISIYDRKNNSEKNEYRNAVIQARIRAIDINYNIFLDNISSESKSLNVGTDSTVLLLGTAGAISTVSSTQAILSATSATVTGVKTSFDKNAYYDSTIPALIAQMNASRKSLLANIYLGLASDYSKYSLIKALIDVEDYFQAGTIPGAVNAISQSSGEQKTTAENKIEQINEGAYIENSITNKLEDFISDKNEFKSKNEAKLKAWMQTNGLQNISLTSFVYSDKYLLQREQAVKDLKIN